MNPAIRARSQRALGDPRLQRNLRQALQHSLERRAELQAENPRWQATRARIAALRDEALDRLPELLDQLRRQLERRGAHLHLVADAAAARATVLQLLAAAGARLVVKGKSMVSEELELNAALEAAGHTVYEGDLGELIVQLRGEPPSHLTAPALHLDRQQIARLFAAQLGRPLPADPEALTAAARQLLRDKFLSADAGITGGNFVIAESGTLVLVENESNIRLASSLPPLHIAITGIEKLVPRLADLAPLLELLPASSTGQKMTAAVSLLGGPRAAGEADGPQAFHLILVDNGRRELLADPRLRSTLRCLRCGACLNICPVFQRLGGHGYGSVYPGPIGVMLSRALLGQRDSAHAFACSLCGACDEICPAQIPLSRHILEVRRRSQAEAGASVERLGHRGFVALARRPALFGAAGAVARVVLRRWPAGWSAPGTAAWSGLRALPRPVGAVWVSRRPRPEVTS